MAICTQKLVADLPGRWRRARPGAHTAADDLALSPGGGRVFKAPMLARWKAFANGQAFGAGSSERYR